MTFTSNVVPDVVASLVLFGSQSRGDSDSSSDTDVAVFANVVSPVELISVKQQLCKAAPDVTFSAYSTRTAKQMAADGSLFLWHLKNEGTVLFQRGEWLEELFNKLVPYSAEKALRDIATFEAVLRDVRKSLEEGDAVVLYENATLYSVLRSLGMIASTIDGHPTFRRLEPIDYLRVLMNGKLLISGADVCSLMLARHIYARNVKGTVDIKQQESISIAEKTVAVAEFVRNYVSQKVY